MGMEEGTIKSIIEANSDEAKLYRRWSAEIVAAEKEVEKWHKQAWRVVKRYKDERDGADTMNRKFNVFSTNVDIMQASLFSKIPKAMVTRRFGQMDDDAARVAALMLQNCIFQNMDEADCDFGNMMRSAITDRLVAGTGNAWVRLETEIETKTLEIETDEFGIVETEPSDEPLDEQTTYDQIVNQEVCIDYVHWDDFLISPCRTYGEKRWLARKVCMDYDAISKRFGKEKADLIAYNKTKVGAAGEATDNPENMVIQETIVYEIWSEADKKVFWYSKSCPELLDSKDDPLQLEGFYPCPKPMFALQSTSTYIPVPDYVMIQDQYSELDLVNNRISMLIQACKVAGLYDASSGDIKRLLTEGTDNQLIPVSNWSSFAEKGGIQGIVSWLPLDTIGTALDKLRTAREDIKAQIYELTGISDIVRGQSKASETLGAQQMKQQFATVRIGKVIEEVAMFAQKVLQLKGEIICKHFQDEVIAKQANIAYYPDGQNTELVASAMKLLKNEDDFNWRVKIESDSMGQVDYNAQKQEKVEFTNAVATFLQSTASVLKNNPELAPVALETLKFAVSGFKASSELEGVIDNTIKQVQQKLAQPPTPPQPDPAMQKMQMEMQMKQQEFGMKQQESQQEMQLQMHNDQMEIQKKQAEMQMDAAIKRQDMAFQQMMNEMKLNYEQQKNQSNLAYLNEKNSISKESDNGNVSMD